ncbi:MAG TPA: PP0621 family protein [Nitrosomonas sp.]|nr:PP0621 family protein [Nitrosomonas sp.]HQX14244.1 PP0621 family protein [Nitrosomonas sp.]HRB20337.1 PP0621 family protein [Nitrosomonas sp.]HRB33294.1 PP0621 family protein [Nitrosomonas sp.]HRB45906.1 PP0621 family protein [Nitrosomonas sp.]
MAKIFFLIIVVIFIFWIIKIQKIQKNKDSLESIEDMVSCVHCNTHIPKKEAFSNDENQYFCSVEHCDAYKKS